MVDLPKDRLDAVLKRFEMLEAQMTGAFAVTWSGDDADGGRRYPPDGGAGGER